LIANLKFFRNASIVNILRKHCENICLQTFAWKSGICMKKYVFWTLSRHSVRSLLPHPGHPVSLSCLMWPVSPACPDQLDFAVLSICLVKMSCPSCPVPAVMYSLSSPGRIFPTVLSRCPVVAVLSRLSCPTVLSQLCFPSWTGPVFFPQLFYSRCPDIAFSAWLSCPSCPVPAVLLAVLSWLSRGSLHSWSKIEN
jgi:hypothetical protein